MQPCGSLSQLKMREKIGKMRSEEMELGDWVISKTEICAMGEREKIKVSGQLECARIQRVKGWVMLRVTVQTRRWIIF